MELIVRKLTVASQVLLTSLVFLLPLFFVPAAWATLPQAKMLIVSVLTFLALFAWVVAHLYKGSVSFPVSFIAASALLLPVVYFVSALVGGSVTSFVGAGVERDTVIAMVLWTFSLCASAVSFNSTRLVLKAYRTLLYSALVVAVLQLLIFFVGKGVFSLGGLISLPPASVVGSWHDLAIFLGLAVFISSTYISSTFAEKRTKIIAMASVAISLITLVLINARDVWIALAAFSLLGAVYLYVVKRLKQNASSMGSGQDVTQSSETVVGTDSTAPHSSSHAHAYGLFAAVALISVVFVFFGNTIHSQIPENIKVVEFEVRPSWEGTFAVASAVYQERGFLFGSGPNTFNRQWGLYKPAGVNETAFWNTDFSQGIGFIPTSIINSGILGGAVWLLFFGMLLYRGVRTLYSPPNDGDGRWHGVFLGLFGGVLYLWFFHFVYPPGVALLAITFILTGLFIASQRVSGAIDSKNITFKEEKVKGLVAIVVLCVISLIALFSLFVSVRALSADMFVNRSVTVFNQTGSIADARKELDRAISMDKDSVRAHRAAVELGIIEFQRFVQEGDTSEARLAELREAIESTINHGLTAVSVNESDYQNWLILARLYEQLAGVQIEGAYANAQSAYERAAAENPTNPEPLARLAQLAITQGDIDGARENLQLALSRKSNYPIAHFLLSQIEASEGNTQAAITAAENAALAAPQEPLAWFQVGVLHHGVGNYEVAIAALEQAVALNNNYANALYVLALDYIEVGRQEDAIQVLERVRELNPENQAVVELISSLESEPSPVAEEGPGE